MTARIDKCECTDGNCQCHGQCSEKAHNVVVPGDDQEHTGMWPAMCEECSRQYNATHVAYLMEIVG